MAKYAKELYYDIAVEVVGLNLGVTFYFCYIIYITITEGNFEIKLYKLFVLLTAPCKIRLSLPLQNLYLLQLHNVWGCGREGVCVGLEDD